MRWGERLVSEPLGLPQFALVATAAILAGALYCQLYCAIAFQPMQGMRMPVAASFAWSATAILPWVVCFELAKRRAEWSRSPAVRGAMIALLFLAAASLSIVLERGVDQLLGVHQTRPVPMQLAAQLPAAMATALLALVGPCLSRRANVLASPYDSPAADVAALAASIQWIEAAGNYVQVHTDRGSSLHRATMRELERSLDPCLFRRIHRSVIVRLDAIESRASLRGSPAVRLRNGTVLKVGTRYAASIA